MRANKIEGASNLKMGKKNAMENGLLDASKKVCLCSPTTHAGSFKCRLHRLDATQKSSSGHSTSTTQSFDLGRIPSEGDKV
ncbi:unnamed protein product [Ilex paraguariensis]|uniref:Uncharacterized protein n=1 Tax=Ilex paraguariensis TaxID=185542 RepID=A0ABC8R797_9AQUA